MTVTELILARIEAALRSWTKDAQEMTRLRLWLWSPLTLLHATDIAGEIIVRSSLVAECRAKEDRQRFLEEQTRPRTWLTNVVEFPGN